MCDEEHKEHDDIVESSAVCGAHSWASSALKISKRQPSCTSWGSTSPVMMMFAHGSKETGEQQQATPRQHGIKAEWEGGSFEHGDIRPTGRGFGQPDGSHLEDGHWQHEALANKNEKRRALQLHGIASLSCEAPRDRFFEL